MANRTEPGPSIDCGRNTAGRKPEALPELRTTLIQPATLQAVLSELPANFECAVLRALSFELSFELSKNLTMSGLAGFAA